MPHLSPMNWVLMFFTFGIITLSLTFYLWWNKEIPLKPTLNHIYKKMTILPW